ncbi:MAG: hypothetical protein WCA63_05695 [Gallionella sp.]
MLSWSMLEAIGENGLLVDFFSPADISERVVNVLQVGRNGYADIRQNARNTIVEKYDLKTICLPAQLKLLKRALSR